jgi:hypothetical protein
VNCSQAREMLSAHRELKKDDYQDTTALDVHLANCADCRHDLDQYHLVGQHIRSLPAVESSSQAYTNLMQALAVEHARFIQRSSSSAALTPAPDFLKPYLKEHAAKDPATEALTAFSKADTGPLPVIRAVPKRSRGLHLNHFAVIGLAAAFLLVLMTGGITSVLWLAQSHQSPGPAQGAGNNITSVQRVSQVTMVSAATTTSYPHVVSAVANRQDIYYSAYGATDSEWMLEQLDLQTHQSTELLPTPDTSPLIVLGSSQNQLVWLQFDPAQPVKNSKKQQPHGTETFSIRTWKLYSLALNTNLTNQTSQTDAQTSATPEVLLQGTFDQQTAPNWVHTPVQGLWFTQDALLIASIDQKGVSHLVEHQFANTTEADKNSKDTTQSNKTTATTTELATGDNGHILTSPTANSDGSSIYWSEEWLTDDNTLHSNVWTQQTGNAAPAHGRWLPHAATEMFQFTNDDKSFRPQVVNDTLFLLQATTTDVTNQLQLTPTATTTAAATTTTTATPQATLTATATTSAAAESGNIALVDPDTYSQPLDASIQGTLQAFSIDTGTKLSPAFGADGPISGLQAGGRFLLWQNSNSNNNNFDMYDVTANIPVNINSTIVPKDAIFLAVNGDSAVWISNADITTDLNDITNSTVKFGTFNWPPPKTSVQTTPQP